MNEQQALTEMAKHVKQNPAVGEHLHETVKTQAVNPLNQGNVTRAWVVVICLALALAAACVGFYWNF